MNTQGYQNPSESSQRTINNNLIKDKNNRLMMGLLLLNTFLNIIYLQVSNVRIMKKLIPFIFLSANLNAQKSDPASHFPFSVGNSWEYETQSGIF